MTIPDAAEQYFAYDSRLASFQTAQQLAKRRASNATTKGPKTLKWPHKFLTAEELARAGFFYYPLQTNPDNVACFLCHKALDGWEEDDDPLAEHLKHSPDCGWAIVAAVERQDSDFSEEYPLSGRMIEARKATFAGRWPHEDKKGWKCKTKQMVDAGWKFTPCQGSDDMATCAYCALALDGWEKGDKPLDEHHNRSPNCSFFTLISNYKQSPKRTKLKKDRTSKASRLSTQSTFTINSEAPSIIDLPAEEGDSILTTATNATSKRMVKSKKATTTKGRKTRPKKDEPTEVVEAPEPEDVNFEIKIDPPKPNQGRKRKSEQLQTMEAAVESEVPPPKRRATRTRGSTAIDSSMIGESEPLPKIRVKKGRPSRKASAASQAPSHGQVPNDDEIDRALEADLERPMMDEEPPQSKNKNKLTSNYSMFGVEPVDINEAEIEAELDAMEIDSKPLPKPKNAKAAPTRKVSAKQRAAAKKAAEIEAQRLAEEEAASQQIAAELEQSISMQHSSPILPSKKQRASTRQPARPLPPIPNRSSAMPISDNSTDLEADAKNESGNETDASMASQSTVVRGGSTRRGSALKKAKGGKKGPSRNIEDIVHKSQEPSLISQAEESTRITKENKLLQIDDVGTDEDKFYTPAPEAPPVVQNVVPKALKPKAVKSKGRLAKASIVPSPHQSTSVVDVAVMNKDLVSIPPKIATPARRSPTPPPKELTPSQSPNSSDAENQPPSSKPSAASKKVISTPRLTTQRIPLADATTPMISPSKRNVIAGLRTEQPWTSVDLDAIFMKSPGGENLIGNATDIFGGAEERIKAGDLTSPEKRMTVEEWIQHNATMAEEKLRNECERMVGAFESQGTRAMRALEGVECLE